MSVWLPMQALLLLALGSSLVRVSAACDGPLIGASCAAQELAVNEYPPVLQRKIFAPMDYPEGGYQDSAPRQEYTGVKTLRALTAKQLTSLSVDDSTSILRIDGAEVSNTIVVGYVTSVRNNSAGVVFMLFDTTGTVECVFWANGPRDELAVESIREGGLLEIIGSVKAFNSKKTVSAASIRAVSTEYLLYHLTSAIYQSLFFQHRIQAQQPSRQSISAERSAGGPAINDDVLQTYRNNQDDNGLDLSLVISMLQSKYSPAQIREANESLLHNCHIYSVDDTHYRTTL